MSDTNAPSSPHTQGVTRMERFVALSPGEYWRATQDIEDTPIKQGDMLLVKQIDDIEGNAHTIHVDGHPGRYDNHFFKFLAQDFVNQFEHVHKDRANAIRKRELQELQGLLADVQTDLNEHCANPDLIDQKVREQEAQEQAQEASLPAVREALPSGVMRAIESQEVTALIAPGLTSQGVAQIKGAIGDQKDVLVKRSEWITSKTKEISHLISKMNPFFKEQANVALAMTSDTRKQIDQLMEGIGSLDLYTLSHVGFRTFREGTSAPEDAPVAVTQRVLFMDEELAVWHEFDEQFNFHDVDLFCEHLANNPGLEHQIFPSERAVVAIAASRQCLGDQKTKNMSAFEEALWNKENQKVSLFIKDGQNLHQVVSPEIRHETAERLFPSRDESDQVFTGFDGRKITYQDLSFTRAHAQHERIALGYKRFLILLCGLDHQHKLLGDFYSGPPTLDFVSQEFQEKHFKFIHDEDGEGLISSPVHQSWKDWLKARNGVLSQGSRVVFLEECITPQSLPSAFEYEAAFKRYYTQDYKPDEDIIFGVAVKRNGRLMLPVALSGQTRVGEDRSFNGWMDVERVVSEYGDSWFRYLCLDDVDHNELRWYLHHRPSRDMSFSGIMLAKKALSVLEQDLAEEAETREALAADLVSGGVAEREEADRIVHQGISKLRVAHSGKPLAEILKSKAKREALLEQLYRLSNSDDQVIDAIFAKEQQRGRTVLRVVLDAKGLWVAYSTPVEEERDDRLVPFDWVAKTRYKGAKKRGQVLVYGATTFVHLRDVDTDGTPLFEDAEKAASWIKDRKTKPAFKTPAEKARWFDAIEVGREYFEEFLSLKSKPDLFEQWMTAWFERYDKINDVSKSGMVQYERLFFPLAVTINLKGEPFFAGVGGDAHSMLAQVCPDEQLDVLANLWARWYRKKANKIAEIRERAGLSDIGVTFRASGGAVKTLQDLFVEGTSGVIRSMNNAQSMLHPLFGGAGHTDIHGPSLRGVPSRFVRGFHSEHTMYRAPGLKQDLEQSLGFSDPEGFDPVIVYVESVPAKVCWAYVFPFSQATYWEISREGRRSHCIQVFETRQEATAFLSESYERVSKEESNSTEGFTDRAEEYWRPLER